MATGRRFAVVLVLNLLVDAFGLPADVMRTRRGYADNELDSGDQLLGEAAPARVSGDSVVASSNDIKINDPLDNAPPPPPEVIKTIFGEPKLPEPVIGGAPSNPAGTLPPIPERSYEEDKKQYESSPATVDNDDDDDEDFDFETMETSPTIGIGSNIFSLLSLLGSVFGGSSGSATILVQRMMKDFVKQYLKGGFTFSPDELLRRKRDTNDNEIETDYTDLTILKPPPARQEQETKESNSSETSENNSLESLEGSEEEDLEEPNDVDKNADRESSDESEDDDEPPGGGDGEGGGILGLLAGLSGGEDGQSDLGSLLAAISGIVANLSGDGVDVNALIASGIGLFVGLLSEGEENPGAVIASYLLTSLDTLSGGGAKNNGNFFGAFLSKLIKGTSAPAAPAPPQPTSWWTPLWNLKLDIIRAFFSASTGLAGAAFSASSG